MADEISDSLEVSRAPTDEDLARLNELGVKYVVIGGFAIMRAGLARSTMDINLLVETSPENDLLIRKALEILPDGAVKELNLGEIERYNVVRVCDEITVDLMAKACGHRYEEVQHLIEMAEGRGVTIPFASPALLWKTKQTFREKDAWDCTFLKKLLIERGEWPVE